MKVTYQVKIGINKIECEDHALIYTQDDTHLIINNTQGSIDINLPAIIAVADGVGGNPGGFDASKFVLTEISKLDFEEIFNTDIEEAIHLKNLKDKFLKINDDLIEYASEIMGKTKMATTLSCAMISENKIITVHCGNTRIYSKNSEYLKQLTTDHTTYQSFMNQGMIEAAENCNKCEITSCLGGGDARFVAWIKVENVKLNNKLPKSLILTSDGIHEFVDENDFEDILNEKNLETLQKTENLIQNALNNNSHDDKTIIIIDTDSLKNV
jgi:protein phosphatase